LGQTDSNPYQKCRAMHFVFVHTFILAVAIILLPKKILFYELTLGINQPMTKKHSAAVFRFLQYLQSAGIK
jgi:hypothetical protein